MLKERLPSGPSRLWLLADLSQFLLLHRYHLVPVCNLKTSGKKCNILTRTRISYFICSEPIGVESGCKLQKCSFPMIVAIHRWNAFQNKIRKPESQQFCCNVITTKNSSIICQCLESLALQRQIMCYSIHTQTLGDFLGSLCNPILTLKSKAIWLLNEAFRCIHLSQY